MTHTEQEQATTWKHYAALATIQHADVARSFPRDVVINLPDICEQAWSSIRVHSPSEKP